MDFFGIGPLELLLILVILIVVVGPEKVPDVARRLGRAVRAFRGATTQITQEIDKELRSIKEDVNISEELRSIKKDVNISEELRSIKEDVKIDISLDGDEKKLGNESHGAGEKGQD